MVLSAAAVGPCVQGVGCEGEIREGAVLWPDQAEEFVRLAAGCLRGVRNDSGKVERVSWTVDELMGNTYE